MPDEVKIIIGVFESPDERRTEAPKFITALAGIPAQIICIYKFAESSNSAFVSRNIRAGRDMSIPIAQNTIPPIAANAIEVCVVRDTVA